jgi:cytoskeleton protein RodZ
VEAFLGSSGIGAKLQQERIRCGLTLDDIARETRISTRFLRAMEAGDFESLPGLVFTRNFVKQFALTLKLDPDPLLAELPKQDESTVRLPDPLPPPPRSSYVVDPRLHSAISSGIWVLLAMVAITGTWLHYRSPRNSGVSPAPASVETAPVAQPAAAPEPPKPVEPAPVAPAPPAHAVEVVITAHQPSWVQVTVDGKTSFTGTLQPDETKEVGADEQVKLIAGNAGALSVSLNGKTLDTLGPVGQVRVVRLTAEGPVFLAKAPPPAPDPL